MIPRKIICARCGGETIARAAGTKYCPVCAYYARLEQARISRAARKARAEAARAAKKPEPEALREALCAATRKARGRPKKEAAEKPKTKKIICARCGVEMEVAKGSRQMYCPPCAKESKRESHRMRGRPEGPPATGTCSRCGRAFSYPYKGYHRTTCDDCRGANYGKAEAGGETKKQKPRVSQIDAKQRAARELGMSYGRYVAMMTMKKGA